MKKYKYFIRWQRDEGIIQKSGKRWRLDKAVKICDNANKYFRSAHHWIDRGEDNE